MAATGLQMQYTGVTFTYAGPTTVAITEVEDVEENFMSEPREWSADAAPGPTAVKGVNARRSVTLVGGNVAKAYAIPLNQEGTLSYVLNDFYNGTGSGAITVTVSRATFLGSSRGGPHNTVQRSRAGFASRWLLSGGVYVDPVAIVVAS